MKAKKSMSMKAVVILMAVVLLIGCAAGGTLAWLMTRTSEVKNTFVAGDVGDLELAENTGNTYMIVPGLDIAKDPVVTFSGNNIDAIVFLKVEAAGWTAETSGDPKRTTYSIGSDDKKMEWMIAEGWIRIDETEAGYDVFYRSVDANATSQQWNVIQDDEITVSSGITKEDLGENSEYLKSLNFTAYAIQSTGFQDISDAWEQAKAQTTP